MTLANQKECINMTVENLKAIVTYIKESRLSSKIVWMSVLSLMLLLGDNYGVWSVIGIDSVTFQRASEMVFGILVLLGVLNNPSDRENF